MWCAYRLPATIFSVWSRRSLVAAVLALLFVSAPFALAAPLKDGDSIVIVVGGDLGLGGSDQPLSHKGGYRHRRLIPWPELTKGVAPLVNGDINFANLETVVTDRSGLRPANKAFRFRMHPAGVRHLVSSGFNVLSTANNHAIDYGQTGMRDTLANLQDLKRAGLLAAPGLGRGRASAMTPALINVKGQPVAISALGIGGGGAPRSETRVGQMSYNSTVDFNETVTALGYSDAAYRILSVHYGAELSIRPSSSAVRKLRDQAVRGAGVDLVLGHHAHVAAGVQIVDGRVIFYGLGNLLHLGMQNMAKFGACRDFGVIGRVHVAADENGRLRAYAIEAIALTNMHQMARQMSAREGARRIAVLNGLARGLDDSKAGAKGVRFRAREDGTGYHCMDGAAELKGTIGALCRDWSAASNSRHGDRKLPTITCGRRPYPKLRTSKFSSAKRRRVRRRQAKAKRVVPRGQPSRQFHRAFRID